jgi:hypothetical protein
MMEEKSNAEKGARDSSYQQVRTPQPQYRTVTVGSNRWLFPTSGVCVQRQSAL